MVVHLWHTSCLYTVCMHSQFLHHTLITCTLHAVLTPFMHMLTYFCTQHTTALQLFFFKMAKQHQINFKEYIAKIMEQEGLMVCQVGERLDAYDRQLNVVSIRT